MTLKSIISTEAQWFHKQQNDWLLTHTTHSCMSGEISVSYDQCIWYLLTHFNTYTDLSESEVIDLLTLSHKFFHLLIEGKILCCRIPLQTEASEQCQFNPQQLLTLRYKHLPQPK